MMSRVTVALMTAAKRDSFSKILVEVVLAGATRVVTMTSAAAAIARNLMLVLFLSIVTVASARTTYAPVMLNAAIILSARGHVEIVLARATCVVTMASAAAAIARMLVLVLFWSIVTVASARATHAAVVLNAATV